MNPRNSLIALIVAKRKHEHSRETGESSAPAVRHAIATARLEYEGSEGEDAAEGKTRIENDGEQCERILAPQIFARKKYHRRG